MDREKVDREEVDRKEVDRKPKYISNLLKSAEIRKKEYERLIERKVVHIDRIQKIMKLVLLEWVYV